MMINLIFFFFLYLIEYVNWPRFLGSQFMGLHIDTNFNDLRVEQILMPLLSRSTPNTIKELVLTSKSGKGFHLICQQMTALETLILYCDDLKLPEKCKLTQLTTLRLSTNTNETRSTINGPLLIKILAQNSNLSDLALENFEITSSFLQIIPKICPKLEKIILSDAFRQSDEPIKFDDLREIIFHLPLLESFTLDVCWIHLNGTHLIRFINGWTNRMKCIKLGKCTNGKFETCFADQLTKAIKAAGRRLVFNCDFEQLWDQKIAQEWILSEFLLQFDAFSDKLEIFVQNPQTPSVFLQLNN